jgi:DNA-binding transcriptional regulator YdaS (Cro superfamily)
MNPITCALEAAGLSQSELASRISVTPQAVNQWVRTGRVPAERCMAVEQITGVSRQILRPDVFGVQRVRKLKSH